MSLEPLQIERVREIIGYTSYDATAALLSRLNSIQETETAQDVVAWNLVRDNHTIIKGGRNGVEIDKSKDRLGIINRVRPRLGLSKITDENQLESNQSGAICYSHPAAGEIDYDCREINGIFE